MPVGYHRCFTFSLLFLSLLSSLSILFTAGRINMYRGTILLVPSSTITEDNPVINSHVRRPEVIERLADIATQEHEWNVETTKPAPYTENKHKKQTNLSKGATELLRLNGSIDAGRDLNTPTDVPLHRSLLREVLDGGMRGHSAVVWRGRERVPDQETRRLQNMFPLSPDFSFPNPQITLPLTEIDRSHWIKSLRRHLAGLSGRKIINLVSSNSQYQDVLLNWLISAVVRSGLELESVLVISMDLPLHTRLTICDIPSVYVPLFQLIRRDTNFTKAFDRVMMLRLSVIRLISHWGFDIHNYDTDAVLLRDPQPLYDQFPDSHMIGSVGRIPHNLMAKWGITVCIGVVIIRSSPHIEEYWKAMSRACLSSLDDQEKLNCGLEALGMTWHNANSDQNKTVVSGHCSNGLEVKVLPFGDVCRLATCDPAQRGSYYIWHKGGSRTRRDKLKGSRDGRTWFLRYKWSLIKNELRGRDWLQSIAYWQATHS